jgi:hypothetical protein
MRFLLLNIRLQGDELVVEAVGINGAEQVIEQFPIVLCQETCPGPDEEAFQLHPFSRVLDLAISR